MDIAIHTNPSQPHQRRYAGYFAEGARRHGLHAEVTSQVDKQSDVHVIIGPWYAKNQWLGHTRVVLLDRCCYKGNPNHVSIGWMDESGERQYRLGCGREPATLKNRNNSGGSIFLADYEGPIEYADTIRRHPARVQYKEELLGVLRRHRLAIGYRTTALVVAGLEGLEVDCRAKDSLMAKDNWLELLPYVDWHYSEIESGELWEHLR